MGFPEDYADRVKTINDELMRSFEVIENVNLRAAMAHYPDAGGKRLRPLLATIVCEAFGGDPDKAIPFGVALEMVHNFTLVHDDVMDEDDTRRGMKTVHVEYGVPEAILAGDAMFARAFEIVLESDIDDSSAVRLVEILARSVRLLADGQQMDLDFEDRDIVSPDEYLEMIERKTAVLYSAAAQGGAIVGGAPELPQEAMFEYGRLIGLGFQIWDDVLDLRSDQETFGKPVLNDIRNGKKTLIVVHALDTMKAPEKDRLMAVLGKKDATDAELRDAKDLLESIGSIEYASRVASEFVSKAKDKLKALKESPHKAALVAFADFMLTRSS
ncbi:MAG: polyprenyl synthetase family protein [Methanobacteriota archaeon]|nr:MAG: polyprenyl synthetase family protein [Euryarchaeota archaeon]